MIEVNHEIVVYLREAMIMICSVSAPPLLTAVIVGFGISFFQAVTQIQEQTLSYVPKILAVFLTLLFCGGWMMERIVQFGIRILTEFNGIAGW